MTKTLSRLAKHRRRVFRYEIELRRRLGLFFLLAQQTLFLTFQKQIDLFDQLH